MDAQGRLGTPSGGTDLVLAPAITIKRAAGSGRGRGLCPSSPPPLIFGEKESR